MARVYPAGTYDDAAVPAAAGDSARQPTILLVEDDVLVRFFVAAELRAQGAVVLEAASAEEALALLRTGVTVDLLLTDVRMPGQMDGTELARRVRLDHPAMKVVVVSGHLREAELGVEVHGFFAKPVDIPRLARQIRALLDGTNARITPFGLAAKA